MYRDENGRTLSGDHTRDYHLLIAVNFSIKVGTKIKINPIIFLGVVFNSFHHKIIAFLIIRFNLYCLRRSV